jgi:serine phosphatase RsbU (regulator of sigma subunit)
VLLREGRAVELEVAAGVPLGLGLGDAGSPAGLTLPLLSGDRLFLASDGVTEARNAGGAFYPLTERLTGFLDLEPAVLVERVWRDLTGHCGTAVDDVTMLVLSPA